MFLLVLAENYIQKPIIKLNIVIKLMDKRRHKKKLTLHKSVPSI